MEDLEKKLAALSEDERIKRINTLFKKKKEEGLTSDEVEEQKILRKIFLKNFRKNMKAQLDRIKIKVLIIVAFLLLSIISTSLVLVLDEKKSSKAALPDNIIRVYLETYGNPSSVNLAKVGTYKINNKTAVPAALTVKVSGSKIAFVYGGKTYTYSQPVTLNTAYYNTSNYITLNSKYKYVGDFEFRIKNSGLQIINYVDMENYTKGVVPYEMSDGNPIEALKAQAIAARTEGYYNKQIARSTDLFDVYNNTKDQMYLGFNLSYTNVTKAVDATKNKLLALKSNGKIIFSPYGASDGGYVEYSDSSRVAGSNLSYMPYKADPYDLKASLNSSTYSAKVTIPKTLNITSLNSSTSQPYVFLRNKLKPIVTADGKTILDLATATVSKIVLTYPSYTDHSRPRAYDACTITLSIKYKNQAAAKSVNLVYTPYKDSKTGYERPFINNELGLSDKLKFILLYLRDDGTSFLLASMRYGHGSGMSQIGAIQMAKDKKTYLDILAFYYSYNNLTKLVTKNWTVAIQSSNSANTSKFVKTSNYGKIGSVVNVGSSYLNVRKTASTSANVLGRLKSGAKVTIRNENNAWYQITVKISGKNVTGYVSKKYIKILPAGLTAKFVKTSNYGKIGSVVNVGSSYLNVRKTASTSANVLGRLKSGAKVTIRNENNAWYQITVKISGKNVTGYVSKKYIKVLK